MPVNMDPSKKRLKKAEPQEAPTAPAERSPAASEAPGQPRKTSENLDTVTDRDKELALADAEWKNLWDATEVIDMDKW